MTSQANKYEWPDLIDYISSFCSNIVLKDNIVAKHRTVG